MSTPQTFDPYRDWLGIKETQRPLDHYQLLRLKRFEDDLTRIRENYQQLNAHIRKQLAGKAAPIAHQLLGQLTKALLCLTDAARKDEYDRSLGRTTSNERRLQKFDDLLLARKTLTREQLVKAQKFSHVTGIELHDAVIQQKLASVEVVAQLRAESLGVSFIDLADAEIDPEVIAKLPAVLGRQHTILPLAIENGQVIVAATGPLSPTVEDDLRLRTGMPVRVVIAVASKLHEAINQHYSRDAAAVELGQAKPVVAQQSVASAAPAVDPIERAKKRQQMTMVAGMLTFAVIAMLGNTVLNWDLLTVYGSGAVLAGLAAGIAWKLS